MTTVTIRQKIARVRAGGEPRVLDMFGGCGGLSLGFHAAGFGVVAAIEKDTDSARSHGFNFHRGSRQHEKPRDVCIPPQILAQELDLGPVEGAFDVIVGGPPCQAFARVGRPKLREIDRHPEAFRHDPRARLYQDWLRYVDVCQPLAVLMENVPDVLNHGGQNIAEEICEVLEEKGYACGYTLLNAALYGVPQTRERMFLIGYRQELTSRVCFPQPSHWVKLPVGYADSRAAALKLLNRRDLFGTALHYVEAPDPIEKPCQAVTAEQAIGDLPPILARKLVDAGILRLGVRRFDKPIPYDRWRKPSEFAHQMRTWPGFEAPEALRDHVIRYLPRDFDLFARMSPGDQYPQALHCAHEAFKERLAELRKCGQLVRDGSAEHDRLKAKIVPPYDVNKFPNKWRKMCASEPARTLMAHLGKDSYSHIHYDSNQARTISVREAARLQSFPDGFFFCGMMNSAFRQIGNAVPPLMVRVLASEMMRVLCANALTADDLQVSVTASGV